MEKKLKIFLMMIGFSFSLIFTNCVEVKKDPKKYYDTIVEYDVIYIEVFPEGWNSDQYQGNDEMEDDEGLNPDPGTDPGVDAEQDLGSDDSGTNPDIPNCADGERRVNIDGETPCLPIATAEALEHIYNDGDGSIFKRITDNQDFDIHIESVNYFGEEQEIYCQTDENDPIHFTIHGFSPTGVLCVHNSLSLSLCKNDANICGDGEWITLFVQEGKISLSEGLYNVEFTLECMDPVPGQNRCDIQEPNKLFQEVKE